MGVPTKLPQLAISVTDKCNFKCSYCRPSGSSVNKCAKALPLAEVVRLLSIAYEKGYRVFRVTGGEPTLRPDILRIIKAIRSFGDDTTILVGTNGALLGKYIKEFANHRNVRFFIGLDCVRGTRKGLPKSVTKELLSNIQILSRSHYVRINMLVLNSNKDQVPDMIDFCSSLGIDLKLHDLYYCESILDLAQKPDEFFDNEYFCVSKLVPYLSTRADDIVTYPENAADCGIPMISFRIDGIDVIIKDSSKGSYYNSLCRSCHLYPCLHGLYCPIIESDGSIQPSNCVNKEFRRKIAYASDDEIRRAFDYVLSVISNSKFESIGESSSSVDKNIQSVDLPGKLACEKCDDLTARIREMSDVFQGT